MRRRVLGLEFKHDAVKLVLVRGMSAATRGFPLELLRAVLSDLRASPGNRLEALKSNWKGHYSIHINDQWRVVFRWGGGNAFDVRVKEDGQA